jgi:hypothetical protein
MRQDEFLWEEEWEAKKEAVMPVGVELEKEHAERILDALRSGGAITPPEGAWRVIDMLNVAGACIFAASHLPQPDLSEEERKAQAHELMENVTAAAEFLAHVFYRIVDGIWDEEFEERMAALVFSHHNFVRTEGWRKGASG